MDNNKELKSLNLILWEKLCETDPKYTKNFKRSGGFTGTAQNPTYAIKKMTKACGSCGTGWGLGKPEFNVVPSGDEIAVYCTVRLWYMTGEIEREVYGVGGDMVRATGKYGEKTSDEAFKASYTDAMTNAMKFIGMAADLHLGMYDDSKYVNSLRDKLNKPPEKTPEQIKAEKDAKVAKWADQQIVKIKASVDGKALLNWHNEFYDVLSKNKKDYPAIYSGVMTAYESKQGEFTTTTEEKDIEE